MTTYDAHTNFAYSTVSTAPSPASSGTSLVVAATTGSRFPETPFNATVWPADTIPLPSNAEIVRVTSRSSDTLTITRTQESSSARSITVGDQIAAAITAKTLTDVESAISDHVSDTAAAHAASAISYSGSSGLSASDVESALDELDAEKASLNVTVTVVTQSPTPTINTDSVRVASITGLAQAITSMTTNLSGTPVVGQTLTIQITDNGSPRGITWGSSFESSTVSLPTTTVASSMLMVAFVWNGVTSKWRCVGLA